MTNEDKDFYFTTTPNPHKKPNEAVEKIVNSFSSILDEMQEKVQEVHNGIKEKQNNKVVFNKPDNKNTAGSIPNTQPGDSNNESAIEQKDPYTRESVKTLNASIKKHVFGQDKVIDEVSDLVKVSTLRVGINPNKPLGCFLFVGPTGVGKTEIAKQISSHFNIPLQRFDMSEYSTKEDVKKLIGTAPGYVGYEEGGILTNAVKEQPYSVVLLDEIEKAHSDINKILLQLMDDGILTDNKGETTQFKNTILIATSNLGAELEYMSELTDEHKQTLRMEIIKQHIAPEIINRYDGIIHFSIVEKDVYTLLVNKFLNTMQNNFKTQQNINVSTQPELTKFIVENSYDPSMGGRPARRFIEKVVLKGLVEKIYDESLNDITDITIGIEHNKIAFYHNDKLLTIVEDTPFLLDRFNATKMTK